jgi:hypothetical protein
MKVNTYKYIVCSLIVLGLSLYGISLTFKKLNTCNQKKGVLVAQPFGGYVCIKNSEKR